MKISAILNPSVSHTHRVIDSHDASHNSETPTNRLVSTAADTLVDMSRVHSGPSGNVPAPNGANATPSPPAPLQTTPSDAVMPPPLSVRRNAKSPAAFNEIVLSKRTATVVEATDAIVPPRKRRKRVEDGLRSVEHFTSPSVAKNSQLAKERFSPQPHEEIVSLLREPKTRPITQEQLVNEVKGIYAGLVMVENKCIEIIAAQSRHGGRLTNEQWQALIALHRTLLHEHHDFLLASQHPAGSLALKGLASKYSMPARMWRHGIHSFFELLRHRLPHSLEHMLSFIYISYSMMGLLYESVPTFQSTWVECMGDIARYRMAVEEADMRDREIWNSVAKRWYEDASLRSPGVGRIQHHLAVLALPNWLDQAYYYSKALVSTTPFLNTLGSMEIMAPHVRDNLRGTLPTNFATAAAQTSYALFDHERAFDEVSFKSLASNLMTRFSEHLRNEHMVGRKRLEAAMFACTQINALFNFGRTKTLLGLKLRLEEATDSERAENDLETTRLSAASELWSKAFNVATENIASPHARAYLHVNLVFVLEILRKQAGDSLDGIRDIHWQRLVNFANSMLTHGELRHLQNKLTLGQLSKMTFGELEEASTSFLYGNAKPLSLPEDLLIRGHIWAESHLAENTIDPELSQEFNLVKEMNSATSHVRNLRLVWTLAQIAMHPGSEFGLHFQDNNSLIAVGPVPMDPTVITIAESASRGLG